MDAGRKYVLFVATGVGLGHLLSALLNSAYYAWRTGRVLVLDMREFHYVSGDKHAGFFEHFSLEFPPDLEVITDLGVVEGLRRDPDLHFLKLETDRLDVDQPFTARVLLIPCLTPGMPYTVRTKRRDVPFHINLRGKLLEAWHQAMTRPQWSGPVIGLHYRSTVGEVTERMTKAITPDYEERYQAVKDKYVATALDVAKQAGYLNPAFLVTSDDMEFVTYVRDRLPNAFSLATRLPDQEWAAWVRAHGHDFTIMSEAVSDLWCLSACDHLVHFRSGFTEFAILNSPKLDTTTTHYVHVPALKEILDSLGPQEAVTWARGAVRKANIRRLQQRYLFDWLADALDRAGQPEEAARERLRAQWHWETTSSPLVDNPERPEIVARIQRGDLSGLLATAERAVRELPGNPYWLAGYGGALSNVLAQMGRWQDAITPAREALEIAPEDPFLYEHLGSVLIGAEALQEAEQAIRQAIEMDGGIGRFYSALAGALMPQGRSAEAVEALREAVRLEPDDPFMARRLGGALMLLGEYDAAVAAFRQALALRADAGTHSDLFDCFSRQGRLDDALTEARAAIALEPENAHWHYREAIAALHTNRLEEAAAAARKAIEYANNVIAFHELLNTILQQQGKPPATDSIELARHARDANPEELGRHLHLGNMLLQTGHVVEAEEALREGLARHEGSVELHGLMSVALERQRRFAEAAASVQRAVELGPLDAERFGRLGTMYLFAEMNVEAEQACRRAISLRDDVLGFHHVLGIALQRQNRMEEAIAEARRSVALAPDNAELRGHLGGYLLAAKHLDEAVEVLEAAIEGLPQNQVFYRWLVGALEQQGRLEKAIEYARKLLVIDPESANNGLQLGNLLVRADQREEAADVLAEAGRQKNSTAMVHQTLSKVLEELGRLDEAIAALRGALTLEPHNREFLVRLGRMLDRTGDPEAAERLLKSGQEIRSGRAPTETTSDVGREPDAREPAGSVATLVRPANTAAAEARPSRRPLIDDLLANFLRRNDRQNASAVVLHELERSCNVPLKPRDDRRESIIEAAEQAAGIPMKELVMQFDSLGCDCELGIIQRACETEPLSLMRFSFMPLPHIIRGVNSGFAGLVENVDALTAADGAWDLRIHQYDMFSHTFRAAATIDKETLLGQQRKRIAYLRDKLLADLAQGEKIFVVWRTEEDLTEDQVMSLFQAMRARGPGRLLWVVRQDPAGVVQEVKPGLMRGTIDRWRDDRQHTEHRYSLQGWLTVLVNAWLLSNKLAAK